MAKPFDRAQWESRVKQDIAAQRETLSALIDDVFVEFRNAGGTNEEYLKTQFFQNLLLRATQQFPDGSADKRAALKLAIIFMRALKLHYRDMKTDEDWKRDHAIRES